VRKGVRLVNHVGQVPKIVGDNGRIVQVSERAHAARADVAMVLTMLCCCRAGTGLPWRMRLGGEGAAGALCGRGGVWRGERSWAANS
jgi:hypothetical protein